MALGERIRHLRKEAGWSQAELGAKVGTDAGRISRYEGGRITPSIDALMRIAEVFNVSADHLLFDDVPRRPAARRRGRPGRPPGRDRRAIARRPRLAAQRGGRPGGKSRLRAMAGDLG